MIIKLRCKLNTILEAIKMVFIAYRKQSLLYTVYKYSADLDISKNHTIRLSMNSHLEMNIKTQVENNRRCCIKIFLVILVESSFC